MLRTELPTLQQDVKDNPDVHLKALSVAFHQVMLFSINDFRIVPGMSKAKLLVSFRNWRFLISKMQS